MINPLDEADLKVKIKDVYRTAGVAGVLQVAMEVIACLHIIMRTLEELKKEEQSDGGTMAGE